MKLMLIESDTLLADSLSSVLKNQGHQVSWHVDLQSAVEAIDQNLPDTIILDLVLAGRSGVEFLYELRSYPEWHKVPVVIWSDLDDEEIAPLARGFKELGVAAFYRKSADHIKELARSLSLQPSAV